MSHPARSRRKANARRRKAAEIRQSPLSLMEQLDRRNDRAHAHLSRYPVPPFYRYSYDEPRPRQPRCYDLQSV
jgi:hypothetical protein